MKLLSIVTVLLALTVAHAQERFELGLGAGSTHPINGDAFKNAASTGDGQNFWLGYGFDKNWGVELGLDNLDFDKVNSKHKAISLSGVYRFVPTAMVHPIAKLGLSSVESKDSADVKTNSMGAKLAAGLEADFKYVSVGGLMNFFHVSKTDDANDVKNTQALQPAVFLTLHNALEGEEKEVSQPQAAAAVVPEKMTVKDSDNDGVSDDDDKCQNTPAGVVVNKIGCSEKENASVRLNVVFATGKAEIDAKSSSDVSSLATFMKKFADTKVEIAGHTDSLGDAKNNQALSQKRADAVKAALVKEGIDASRVAAVGYGSSKPVADNKTKAGRDQNRRVNAEISVDVDKKK